MLLPDEIDQMMKMKTRTLDSNESSNVDESDGE